MIKFSIIFLKYPFSFRVLLRSLFLIATLCFSTHLPAQSTKVSSTDFSITGETVRTGADCFRLTSAQDWSSGAVWYKSLIDLNSSFNMELNIMFGCDNTGGADGIVFVFSPYNGITGYQGEGMGFAGLQPSIGIEVDTWENDHLADPPEDHIAILQHGYVHHYYSLAGPRIVPNVEDCKLHKFAIRWDHRMKQLSVHLDGSEILTYTGDIVKEIFSNKPKVYWGVTAATGRYYNRHEICFKKLDFSIPLVAMRFPRYIEKKLLNGESMTIPNLQYKTGRAIILDASFPDLHRIINLMKENSSFELGIHGHTDDQGSQEVNLNLSLERATAVADYLIKHGVPEKKIHIQGFGEIYPKTSNVTAAGRQINRRVDIRLFEPRT